MTALEVREQRVCALIYRFADNFTMTISVAENLRLFEENDDIFYPNGGDELRTNFPEEQEEYHQMLEQIIFRDFQPTHNFIRRFIQLTWLCETPSFTINPIYGPLNPYRIIPFLETRMIEILSSKESWKERVPCICGKEFLARGLVQHQKHCNTFLNQA